jgi:hypothetical protein
MSANGHTAITERTTVRRERHFSNEIHIVELVRVLRESRSTGELSIHFSQGGISAVTFSEQQHLPTSSK